MLQKAITLLALALVAGMASAQWQVDAERGNDAVGFGLLVYCGVAFLDIRAQWRKGQATGLIRAAIWAAGLVAAAVFPIVLWLIVVVFGGMMLWTIIKAAVNR